MADAHQLSHTELVTLFAEASNLMHVSLDIPSIMRVASLTAMQLVDASAVATGLLLDDKLAFSEYYDGQAWKAYACRFGSENGWIDDLISHRKVLAVSQCDEPSPFDENIAPVLAQAEQFIAIPVIGKEDDLLACMLLFDGNEVQFDALDCAHLELLASMMSVAIDNSIQLSENRRVEEDLEKSVATYRTLVEQIPAITYIATLDRSRILFVSPQVEDILGYSQDDFLANQETWAQQIHEDDRERVLSEVRESMKSGLPFHSEYRIHSKSGRDIWVKDAAATVRDHDHDLYLQGVVHDITERKESEEKLVQMAHFDQLTGLANRALFLDRLDQSVAQAKRHRQGFAVLFLDLDGFKAVNDNLGHKAGDILLAEAAHRLAANVREVDTVARMGGDEFTIILNEVSSRESIEHIAQKLLYAISAPYEHIDAQYKVTLSMGIALYPEDGMNRDGLITAADNAMYKAKNSGKNCFSFHQS
ncbi:diguanylate cyclase [Mariprofundus sp. KV]|uniref:sensor domain-containing diguanylate cyclase n=1 Tax=Mariprofundus sp. KV TaxID=2608715 RepID=UPI0015A4D27D|nr:diguanylate cyclase [Mariprofundus sp. KV]NWF35885.1 sensor domain-containing diguanylate cyclase [Mariprofundus sp. KV]